MLLPWSRTGSLLAAVPLLASAALAARTCQPDQDCWPTKAQWQAFNQTISGRLHVSVPLGSACFESSPGFDPAQCDLIRNVTNYMDATFRSTFDTSMEMVQYEACGSANCYPGVFFPEGETCSLGRFAALYVLVEDPSDISAAMEFTRQHNIRYTVRNTGHDFIGRNAAPNSLTIFTRRMKNMSFEAAFTPKDCPAAGTLHNIGIIGAGVNADDAVPFFDQHGMMAPVGTCSTVGTGGGYSLGGGHSVLTPHFGLMADHVVEIDVVTADGQLRTVNECNDPDLFWALRGGGGGTFGVQVNLKFQLHPANKFATWLIEADINIDPNDPDVTKNVGLRDALTLAATESPKWLKNSTAGFVVYAEPLFVMIQILPVGEDPLATLKEMTASANATLSNHPGLTVVTNQYVGYANQNEYLQTTRALFDSFSPSGIGAENPSRLATQEVFEPDAVDATVAAIINGIEQARLIMGGALGQAVSWLAIQTGALSTPDEKRATSVNPAWRDTVWHTMFAEIWQPGTADDVIAVMRRAAHAGLDEVKKILPVQAAYFNEADPEEEDFGHVFWGENYPRLLEVKAQYDPDGDFSCRRCVAYTSDDADPMFSCYTDNPVPSVPFDMFA